MILVFRIIGFPLRLAIGLAGAAILSLALAINPQSRSDREMLEELYDFVRGI